MCILSYIYGSNSLELGEVIELFYVVQDFCLVTVDGEHIFLLKISISKNLMKQSDENLSELELKSFWYKLHKKVFVQKMIWLYLS